jgi:Putative peptidoglycan binding domain
MARYRLLIASLAAVLLAIVFAGDVYAQDNRCKDEQIKASGKATFWGNKRATRLAIDNWQREVRQKYGEQFMDFTKARRVGVDCGSAGIGTIGSRMKRCNVSGYPCSTASDADDEDADKGWRDDDPIRRVVAIQRRLVRAGFLERDDVDGQYGSQTRRAVRRFQRENDLRDTGEVDENTWDKLRKYRRS